jgi:hypothetical protein
VVDIERPSTQRDRVCNRYGIAINAVRYSLALIVEEESSANDRDVLSKALVLTRNAGATSLSTGVVLLVILVQCRR